MLPFSSSFFLRFTFRLKAAFNAYVDRELPNIREEVRGPSPLSADSALTVITLIATGTALATVQGAAHHLRCLQSPELISVCQIGFALQAIPKVT